MLLERPGYLYQALFTNLTQSAPPLEVWRPDNPRAGCEEVIEQLDTDYLKSFWSTEAALSLTILSYTLTQLFHHHLG